jgi:hypothetical protein
MMAIKWLWIICNMKSFSSLQEDLRKWFSKTDPAGDWKRINSKGEVIGPCAREPGEPKPKCMSRAKRESLTKKERASAVRAKRKHDPNPERKGEPINVSNFGKGKISENMENLEEKNVPTSPEKWAQAKAQAKAKFDVYPSAYANGWAAKKYKEMGGSWKSVSEESEQSEEQTNLHELKTTTLLNYRSKAVEQMPNAKDKLAKRLKGIGRSGEKIKAQNKAMMSKKEFKEEVEQIDEISKTTLGSYVKRASQDAVTKAMKYASKRDESGKESGTLKKISDRESGIRKATDRLTKEEVDLDEASTGMGPFGKGHVTIHSPGHRLHGKKANVFHKHEDGRVNVQIRHSDKKGDVTNLTLKPNQFNMNEESIKEQMANAPFDSSYSKKTGTRVDKKDVNYPASPAQKTLKPSNKSKLKESRRLEIVREAMIDAKKKDQKKKIENKVEMNGSDKFQSEPVLSSQIIKNNV